MVNSYWGLSRPSIKRPDGTDWPWNCFMVIRITFSFGDFMDHCVLVNEWIVFVSNCLFLLSLLFWLALLTVVIDYRGYCSGFCCLLCCPFLHFLFLFWETYLSNRISLFYNSSTHFYFYIIVNLKMDCWLFYFFPPSFKRSFRFYNFFFKRKIYHVLF